MAYVTLITLFFAIAGASLSAVAADRAGQEASDRTAGPQTAMPRVEIEFAQTRLANGLRVITVADRRAPIVSVVLVYDVGSANEVKGRTGFAHLFEHMLFQGSKNIAPGLHTSLIESYGGRNDAMTANDFTLYYDSVPANQLELALFLEAERLKSLAITPGNFARERQVVKEERRMRIDNQPYGGSNEVLNALLYDNFAYQHSGIGSMADLDAASVDDLQAFFDTYYIASNVVLVLAGDFDRNAALALVEKHFANLPLRPRPPAVDRREPAQTAQRRRIVEDPLAPVARLAVAYKAVPGDHPDFFALQVLSAVLQDGHSSRLHEALVKRGRVTEISGYVDELRGPGALYFTALLAPHSAIEQVEAIIDRQIALLQDGPISDWELYKARNSIATRLLGNLYSGLTRAFYIGRSSIDFGDPNRINTYLEHIAAVTAKDVQRVAKTYLRRANRTAVVTLPKQPDAQSVGDE